MKANQRNRSRSCLFFPLLGFGMICVLLAGIAAISNLVLPAGSANTAVLTDLDKYRLMEAEHLRENLGDEVWPGFGKAVIPTIVFNREYAFLVGIQDPEPGWVKVPVNEQRGGPWEPVGGDTYQGAAYYRQKLTNPDISPEAFTVLVGDQWVASMTTRDWTEIGIAEPILADFPGFLHPILPYKLFVKIMLGDSERYISLIQHEAFHAYQGQTAYTRLSAGEMASYNHGKNYPWDSSELTEDWKTETDLLVKAVRSSSMEDAAGLTRQFLAQRDQRRIENGLSSGMIEYERLREIEEGLAKYVQIQILRAASGSPDYRAVSEIAQEQDFHAYRTAEKFFKQELSNAKTSSEDTRFYYTGMLQAMLLDQLLPGWKERIFTEDTNLERLLAEAVQ